MYKERLQSENSSPSTLLVPDVVLASLFCVPHQKVFQHTAPPHLRFVLCGMGTLRAAASLWWWWGEQILVMEWKRLQIQTRKLELTLSPSHSCYLPLTSPTNNLTLCTGLLSCQCVEKFVYLIVPCGGSMLVFGPVPVLFSCTVVSDSLQPHGLQYARLPYPSPSPRACSNSCPLSLWCHPTISSCHPLLLLPSVFPSITVSSNEPALCIMWPKYWSFGFSISPSNEYSGLISFRIDSLDLLAVQKSSRTPQFKSINSLALSFLNGPTLTSIHDYWKNHSFD